MNTVITVVVLLVLGGLVWNYVRNNSSFGGSGSGSGGGRWENGRNEEENDEE